MADDLSKLSEGKLVEPLRKLLEQISGNAIRPGGKS